MNAQIKDLSDYYYESEDYKNVCVTYFLSDHGNMMSDFISDDKELEELMRTTDRELDFKLDE